jgi:glucosamine-6-phosphate deaminase
VPLARTAASRVRVQVLDTSEAVAKAAADVVTEAARERPELALALPTGRTPVPFYNELAERRARGALDLSRARGFNLDELVLPRDDPRTFRFFMGLYAWGRTGLVAERCEIPDGTAPDLEAECARYESAIAAAGGLDLAILGIGADGHVAYNMPGDVTPATHVARLPDALAASLDVAPEHRPLRAITMGIGTIRSARRILVLATGESKAAAVRALVHGPERPRWPCSFLTTHPALELLCDKPAALAL